MIEEPSVDRENNLNRSRNQVLIETSNNVIQELDLITKYRQCVLGTRGWVLLSVHRGSIVGGRLIVRSWY